MASRKNGQETKRSRAEKVSQKKKPNAQSTNVTGQISVKLGKKETGKLETAEALPIKFGAERKISANSCQSKKRESSSKLRAEPRQNKVWQ